MASKIKNHFPILLNYTGEIVRIKMIPGSDPRFKRTYWGNGTSSTVILPSLGKPRIKNELVKGPNDVFPTMQYTVEGLPAPMKECFYIVSEPVAKILSRHRNDLMILIDVNVINSENPLKADEIILECSDLAHVLVSIS